MGEESFFSRTVSHCKVILKALIEGKWGISGTLWRDDFTLREAL